jgi:enoyl-[acyl-carrier protein] reductase I
MDSMGRFDGLKGVVLGVANDHSIAWAIAKEILAEGGQIGFSHLPDRPDDERQRNRRRVAMLTDAEPNAKFLVPMDAGSDEQIAAVMQRAKDEFGTIDFLVHSIAYAPMEDLKGETTNCSREGFRVAMETSAYSLLAVGRLHNVVPGALEGETDHLPDGNRIVDGEDGLAHAVRPPVPKRGRRSR